MGEKVEKEVEREEGGELEMIGRVVGEKIEKVVEREEGGKLKLVGRVVGEKTEKEVERERDDKKCGVGGNKVYELSKFNEGLEWGMRQL